MLQMNAILIVLRCMGILVLWHGYELFVSTNVSTDLEKVAFQMKTRFKRDVGAATWPELEEMEQEVTSRNQRTRQAEMAGVLIQSFWRSFGESSKKSQRNSDSESGGLRSVDAVEDNVNRDTDVLEDPNEKTNEKSNDNLAANEQNNKEPDLDSLTSRSSVKNNTTTGNRNITKHRIFQQSQPEDVITTDTNGILSSVGMHQHSQQFPSRIASPLIPNTNTANPYTPSYDKSVPTVSVQNQKVGIFNTDGVNQYGTQYGTIVHPATHIPNNVVYQQYMPPLQVPFPLQSTLIKQNPKSYESSTNQPVPMTFVPGYQPTSHFAGVPQPSYPVVSVVNTPSDMQLNPMAYQTHPSYYTLPKKRPVSAIFTYPYSS